MEFTIAILSIILLIIFITLHFFFRKEIKNVTEQLKEINEKKPMQKYL